VDSVTTVTRPSISISLSRFVDFCAVESAHKVTKVGEIQRQFLEEYRPGGDYWQPVRSAIVDLHRRGASPASLPDLVRSTPPDREDNFASAIQGYQRFLGRKRVALTRRPPRRQLRHGDLAVRLNPELELELQGRPRIVKLHFKRDLPLTRTRVDPVLYGLSMAYGPEVGVVDVHRGKLWVPTKRTEQRAAALRGDLAAFGEIWDALLERRSGL
jgi:hypothetical protein